MKQATHAKHFGPECTMGKTLTPKWERPFQFWREKDGLPFMPQYSALGWHFFTKILGSTLWLSGSAALTCLQLWTLGKVRLLLDNIVILIKKVSMKIHQKCPRVFTHFVYENLPFMSTRILPPRESGSNISCILHLNVLLWKSTSLDTLKSVLR